MPGGWFIVEWETPGDHACWGDWQFDKLLDFIHWKWHWTIAINCQQEARISELRGKDKPVHMKQDDQQGQWQHRWCIREGLGHHKRKKPPGKLTVLPLLLDFRWWAKELILVTSVIFCPRFNSFFYCKKFIIIIVVTDSWRHVTKMGKFLWDLV